MHAEVTAVLAGEGQKTISAGGRFGDGEAFEVNVPIGGAVSDAVAALRQQTMVHMNAYLQSHNMNAEEEVDLMEEVVEEDSGDGPSNGKKNKGAKGQKRKK